jgi:hypothetical protein
MAEKTEEVKVNALNEDVEKFIEKADHEGTTRNGRRIAFHFTRRKRKAR